MSKVRKCFRNVVAVIPVFVMNILIIQPCTIAQIVKKSNVILKYIILIDLCLDVSQFTMGNSIVVLWIGGVVSVSNILHYCVNICIHLSIFLKMNDATLICLRVNSHSNIWDFH